MEFSLKTDFEIREILRLRVINPNLDDLSISEKERLHAQDGDLEKFWHSRMQKKDPIARIGYTLWAKEFYDVARALNQAGKAYRSDDGKSHLLASKETVKNTENDAIGNMIINGAIKDTVFWEFMASSTILNLYCGILFSDFEGDHDARMARVREIGVAIAKAHVKYVDLDIKKRYGKIPGLLSLEQLADYHHEVFRDFSIKESNYGGTFSSLLPDQLELMMYGHWYCRDCDAPDGYKFKGKNRW